MWQTNAYSRSQAVKELKCKHYKRITKAIETRVLISVFF